MSTDNQDCAKNQPQLYKYTYNIQHHSTDTHILFFIVHSWCWLAGRQAGYMAFGRCDLYAYSRGRKSTSAIWEGYRQILTFFPLSSRIVVFSGFIIVCNSTIPQSVIWLIDKLDRKIGDADGVGKRRGREEKKRLIAWWWEWREGAKRKEGERDGNVYGT
jgi:hypothetical protein